MFVTPFCVRVINGFKMTNSKIKNKNFIKFMDKKLLISFNLISFQNNYKD